MSMYGDHDDSDWVKIEATFIHQTADAFLLEVGEEREWVPKSLCRENDDGTYSLPEWKVEELGFDAGVIP